MVSSYVGYIPNAFNPRERTIDRYKQSLEHNGKDTPNNVSRQPRRHSTKGHL